MVEKRKKYLKMKKPNESSSVKPKFFKWINFELYEMCVWTLKKRNLKLKSNQMKGDQKLDFKSYNLCEWKFNHFRDESQFRLCFWLNKTSDHVQIQRIVQKENFALY